jgi:hypothetical protein
MPSKPSEALMLMMISTGIAALKEALANEKAAIPAVMAAVETRVKFLVELMIEWELPVAPCFDRANARGGPLTATMAGGYVLSRNSRAQTGRIFSPDNGNDDSREWDDRGIDDLANIPSSDCYS